MALPTIKDVQAVDPVLTNLLIGYMQADDRFLALQCFPPVNVEKDSGTYYIFDKKYWFLREMKVRAAGDKFARGGVGLSTATYKTVQVALAFSIADEVRANSQVPMDLEQAALRWLAQQSLIEKEIQFATDFMALSVWGTDDNNAATDWDDFASGDPVDNVLTASRTISNNTGNDPNCMCLGYIVHQALVNHPDIIDRLKYTQGATMATIEQALAAIFGKARYMVGKATYSNTNEAAAFSATAIVDDDCLVCHVDPSAGIFGATCGKTFVWQPGGGLGSVAVWRDGESDADLLKHKEQWDQKATATDLGYFFADIV